MLPSETKLRMKFWLLQGLGWTPYALLQLLLDSDDRPRDSVANIASALMLVALAIAGSLLLRRIYRSLQARSWGELRWLGVVLLASTTVALGVDAVYYALLWSGAQVSSTLQPVYNAQPIFARAPLLDLLYLVWSLLYLALSRQQRLERAALTEQSLQLALKEAQVQSLMGQLSPHFIFNALNNIRALILKDSDSARTLLTQFAAMLRYQFAHHEQARVTLNDELKTVHDYVDLMRLQLGKRLQYAEHIDADALPLLVPRFSLQLLVENAMKHGLSRSSQPGQLRIDIEVQGPRLQVAVRNTGTLGDRAASAGIGLRNLEQRLQLLHNDQAEFELRQEGPLVLARFFIEQAT